MNKRLFDVLLALTLLGAITQSASASVRIPDVASSGALLGVVFVGLASLRRFARR